MKSYQIDFIWLFFDYFANNISDSVLRKFGTQFYSTCVFYKKEE